MSDKADKTRQRILDSAKKEFLEKGYTAASLRVIAKGAGVTTGALYGSFADKESLFEAIVGECAEYFLREYTKSHTDFVSMEPQNQISDMHSFTNDILERLINYMFDHLDEFRLLISFSEGSKYSNWMDRLIEIEEDSTKEFISVLESSGKKVEKMNPDILHMLAGSFLHGVMETVAHQMERKEAFENIKILQKYATAGWDALLGI